MIKHLLLIIKVLIMTSSTFAQDLNVKIFNSGKNAIFPVTSTIIYGKKRCHIG